MTSTRAAEEIVNSIATVGLLALIIWQVIASAKDLRSDGAARKQLWQFSHRDSPPERDREGYKEVVVWTLVQSILSVLHCFASLLYLLLDLDRDEDPDLCRFSLWGRAFTFFLAKYAVYIVLAYRLKVVYGGTSYNVWRIFLLASLIIFGIFVLGFELGVQLVAIGQYRPAAAESETFGISPDCELVVQPWYSLVYVLGDTLANLQFCYNFIQPLRALIRYAQKHNAIERQVKLIKAGKKMAIISVALVFSTYVAAIVYTATYFYLWCVDLFVNAACLVLMLDYRPFDKIYHVCCYPCIRICNLWGLSNAKVIRNSVLPKKLSLDKIRAAIDSKSGRGQSIDTLSAVRLVANEATAIAIANYDSDQLISGANKQNDNGKSQVSIVTSDDTQVDDSAGAANQTQVSPIATKDGDAKSLAKYIE